MDPRTLAFYCLGPDPSFYMLRLINIEGICRSTLLSGFLSFGSQSSSVITGCCGLEDLVGFLRDMWVVRGGFELLERFQTSSITSATSEGPRQQVSNVEG